MLFHIMPTPTSWMIWTALWVVLFIVSVALGILASHFLSNHNKVPAIVVMVIVIVLWVIGIGAGISSGWYNYTHSADYIESEKTYKQNYDTKSQHREITVKDIKGNVIYHYEGYFKFSRKGHGLNLVNVKNGKKVSMYIGDNDSVTVIDR